MQPKFHWLIHYPQHEEVVSHTLASLQDADLIIRVKLIKPKKATARLGSQLQAIFGSGSDVFVSNACQTPLAVSSTNDVVVISKGLEICTIGQVKKHVMFDGACFSLIGFLEPLSDKLDSGCTISCL